MAYVIATSPFTLDCGHRASQMEKIWTEVSSQGRTVWLCKGRK